VEAGVLGVRAAPRPLGPAALTSPRWEIRWAGPQRVGAVSRARTRRRSARAGATAKYRAADGYPHRRCSDLRDPGRVDAPANLGPPVRSLLATVQPGM